jgi:DnaJ-class molecular chaperone
MLRSKGFEKLTGKGRGDQEVTLHATVPKRLSAKQKKLLAEFEESFAKTDKKTEWW